MKIQIIKKHIDNSKIYNLRSSIYDWVERGVVAGSFLTALEDMLTEHETMVLKNNSVWIDVNDKTNPMPKNTDFLIKLEDGQIRRHGEDWQDEMLLVTHWKSF